ncbi:hypothetical protein PSHT_09477 [Puccinia striiformis]|uniref:DUF262 domain-containing protein n=1 Tax=Puccinia striiformis TaxID=27350 RepID=A0A2S4VGV0_9BASI|nr:hypothetical protein PSHT_09477 [Puccinia striiformis]
MPVGYVTDSDDDTDQLEGEGSDNEQEDEIIPGALRSAHCRVWSTWELYERMKENSIDINPPYQRDVVWTKAKWVPTLLFSEHPATKDRHGKKRKAKWVCMDGKQRLTSIQLFYDGVIPWNSKPKEQLFFKQSDPPSPSRKLLTSDQQDLFKRRALTAAMYDKLTEIQERDIFRLVQEGKPLTTGEKMQACSGVWGEYVTELVEQYMTRNESHPNGWSGRISNLKRGTDFKTMAQIVILLRDITLDPSDPPRFLSMPQVSKELGNLPQGGVPNNLKVEIKETLDYFMDISLLAPPKTEFLTPLPTPEALFRPYQKSKRTMISPVEMVAIPYLITVHGEKLPKTKILEMVELYKIDVRKKFPNEVKSNSKLTAWTTEWIIEFNVARLEGKYTGWYKPRENHQPAEPGVPQPEDVGLKPEGAGVRDFRKRNLSIQTVNGREAPTPDPTNASSPSTSTTSLSKRPRRSTAGATSQGPANSPTIPFSSQSQRNPVPREPAFANRPVNHTRSSASSTTNAATTGEALKARALALRAQQVLTNGGTFARNSMSNSMGDGQQSTQVQTNGSTLVRNSMGDRQQSTTGPLTSSVNSYHAAESVFARRAPPPNAAQPRLVQNYPSHLARPASSFQLPNRAQGHNMAQNPQQQTNANVGFRLNPQSAAQSPAAYPGQHR